ncbi:hypothetical protein BB560_004930 [Smittium megazygosporum]|uniref:3-methyl-2-oxobutanoate hydroxymethyltransferase n=1 Tax=Smittium megazygosporum TaxID=133381 RepID=A0A2T9Z7V3_9FUNG|nr:hypothetical protein BB560_004930 [Smittium megazygosporum]
MNHLLKTPNYLKRALCAPLFKSLPILNYYSSSTKQSEKKVTLTTINKKYREGQPISMITVYDYSSGLAANESSVDSVLVGDSLGMTTLGFKNTNPVTLDMMIHHACAAFRGGSRPFFIVDMPFGSYNKSNSQAVESAVRLVSEGNAECVKVEGGSPIIADRVKTIVQAAGISVCAHIGLTPQSSASLGGFRVQGKTLKSAQSLIEQALLLQDAGSSMIVLEAMPEFLGKAITKLLSIPTIGIGAGGFTSGQVLVLADILNLNMSDFQPKFVKRYANLGPVYLKAINEYAADVHHKTYPEPEVHTYPTTKQSEEEIKSLLVQKYSINLD